MPKPYSEDFRKKVVDLIIQGYKRKDIAKLFDITEAIITRWKNKFKNNESLKPKENYQRGHSHKFNDEKLNELSQFIKNKNDVTYEDMSKQFNVAKSTIWKALKKLNFTCKKKQHLIQKSTWIKDWSIFQKFLK
jgi:transposase